MFHFLLSSSCTIDFHYGGVDLVEHRTGIGRRENCIITKVRQ
jgi:hypothetical protein